MSIVNSYQQVCSQIPTAVSLVAVSKFRTVEDINVIYQLGHRDFGENRVQELVEKYEALPKDIHWHMIGNLQTNKVKYIAPFIHLIHSISSEKLLKEIDKQAAKNQRKIDGLLQVYIAQEESKSGFDIQEIKEILASLEQYPNVNIQGLMGMATFTDDDQQVTQEFEQLQDFFVAQQQKYPQLQTLSMGMSGDFVKAISCGSTIVRVGSSIFKED